jgi:hypothetical protein
MSNLDAALSSLATEVNELEADRKSGNNSKQVAMGHKLIAIRELLREKNGENIRGGLDATGRHAPTGWEQWVRENLTISSAHASKCVKHAVDPEGAGAYERERHRKSYAVDPCKKILNYLQNCLPHCTQDEKERILNRVYNSFKKADAA